MSRPDDSQDQEGRAPPASGDRLEGALSALEGMLENRHVVPGEHRDAGPGPGPHSRLVPEPEVLPLLQDVVEPGAPVREASSEAEGLDRLPPHNDLVTRLVSELDVIIEACVDEALDKAKKELMARLKNHLEIVLPEILEELERRQGEG